MSSSQVVRVFEAALALPHHEQESYVRRECAGDPETEAEVLSLLGALQSAQGFLGAPTADRLVDDGGDRPSLDASGSQIGPYRLLHLIGEGGFGSVYMAEQSVPIRRRVAIKLLKPGMDSRLIIARFEQERQALAMMDHPNIARVLDAGTTQTGLPYFVMELVRGDSITKYCDQNLCTVSQRLQLFAAVCQGVQHAHSKGIIHRDLKPGNVLVTLVDSKPVPKIIDFGIAKALYGPLTEMTLFTEHRQLIGTPEYMSPEQACSAAQDVDTRSDVYALGVLLYELLTGTTPFDARRLRSAAWAEMQRIIREDEPPLPSTRLGRSSPESSDVARSRGANSQQLGRAVRGELDWIVMRCLEKDRTRRYDTASALATDLRRFMNGEPIEAAPPSRVYRAAKFVRRHRAAVGAFSAILLALIAGTIGTTWGLVDAREQRNAARLAEAQAKEAAGVAADESARAKRAQEMEAAARVAALEASKEATLLMGFSDRLIGAANPDLTHTGSTTVRQLLDDASRAVGTQFSDHPSAEFAIRVKLGRAYWAQRDAAGAVEQFRRAELLLPNQGALSSLERFEFYWTYTNAVWWTGSGDGRRLRRELQSAGRDFLQPQVPEVWGELESMRDSGLMWSQVDEAKAMHSVERIIDSIRRLEPADGPVAQTAIRCLMLWGIDAAAGKSFASEPDACLRIALRCDDEALGLLLRTRAETNSDVALVREQRLMVMRDLRDFRGMIAGAREWAEAGSRVLPAEHWMLSLARVYEGIAELRLGNASRGAELLVPTVEPLMAAPGLARIGNGVRERIAEAMRMLGKEEGAIKWEEQAAVWCMEHAVEPTTASVLALALGPDLRDLFDAFATYDRLLAEGSADAGRALRELVRIGREKVRRGDKAERFVFECALRRDLAFEAGRAAPGIGEAERLVLDEWLLETATRIPGMPAETIGGLQYHVGFRLLLVDDSGAARAETLSRSEALLRASIATFMSFDPQHPYVALCKLRLGHALYGQGRYEEAADASGDSAAVIRAESGAGSIYSALAMRWRVASLAALNRHAEARAVIADYVTFPGWETTPAWYLRMMARAMLRGEGQSAEELALAVKLAQRAKDVEPGSIAGASLLARALAASQRTSEADGALAEARQWRPAAGVLPSTINEQVWELVKDPDVQPEVAAAGVTVLRPIADQNAKSDAIANTLAVGMYRAGAFSDSANLARRLVIDRRANGYAGEPLPSDRAVLAMSLWRLGRSNEARAVLADMPPSDRAPTQPEDERDLVGEAIRVVGGGG